MPIRFPSLPWGSLALALNLSGRCLLDSWVPGRLHSFAPCVARPFRHLPLKRPGTPFIKIFANPVKSLLIAFPCSEFCNFVLKSCNFVLTFSSLNPNRSLDFGEIARLCHAACFSPSRRRSGLRRGVARNRMRTEAGKMPESLIFLTENSPGVSNDRFGLNGKVCGFSDVREHLKGTLIYYFFDEPIATDCRPPPPACPVKLTCLPPLNPARPALPLPSSFILLACLLLHIRASSRVALLVMPCPAIPLASSLFYSWIA